VRNSRKTIFINSITTSRNKWIQTIRESIAKYCALAFQMFQDNNWEEKSKKDELQQLRFLIKLQLNRNDTYDELIIKKLDLIANPKNDAERQNIEVEINRLIELTQDLLKLEWEGVKEESKKGNLSKRMKRRLNNKYLNSKENAREQS
ncbi:MAG: hypothetical protein ACXVHT_12505, partial [Methanobacterium sp.]